MISTSHAFSGTSALFYHGTATGVGAEPSETGGITRTLPNTITLDGYSFAVDLNEWRSGPQETFRDMTVATDQATDAMFNAYGAWARYRYSWHHGSGQTLADFDDLADAFRSESLTQIAWWTRYQAELAPATTLMKAATGAVQVLIASGDYVFLSDDATLYRSSSAMSSWTTLTAPGGNVQSMTTDGTDLYVATTTVLKKYAGTSTTPTAFATPVTGNCTLVGFVGNRLLLAKDNVLYEVLASGALTTIKTHYQASFRWTTILGVGSRIYIGGYAGTRSELFTVTTDSAGALVQSEEVAALPVGELLRGAVSIAGSAVICTSRGVRVAEISSFGTLTYGPLLVDTGDVRAAASDGRYLFTGCSAYSATRSGVMRLVLDDEVQQLQPAYGRDVSHGGVGTVTGVLHQNDLTSFVIAGVGLYLQNTSYETEGVIESGRISFGTVEPKALIGATASFAPLEGTQTVQLAVYDENGVNIGSNFITGDSATTLAVDLYGAQVPFSSVRVTLSGDGTGTPRLFRWRLRAYPIPPPVLQWVLPLIIHERVVGNIGEGQTMSYDVDGIHTWIENLWATRQYTILRIGSREYRVRVDNFEWRPQSWTSNGDVPQGQLIVQLIDA